MLSYCLYFIYKGNLFNDTEPPIVFNPISFDLFVFSTKSVILGTILNQNEGIQMVTKLSFINPVNY